MTLSDVLIQIFSEVSGEPENQVKILFERFKKEHPDLKVDKILTEEEAGRLITESRRDKSAVRVWLGQGFLDTIANN